MTRLPAKPRPSDDAPDWRDIVIGVSLWAVLTAGAIMAHAAATGGIAP